MYGIIYSHLFRPLFVVTVSLSLSGCFLFGSSDSEGAGGEPPEAAEDESPAKELGAADKVTSQAPEGELFKASQKLYQTRMYTLARQSFQTLHDQYPMGAYGSYSEIKLADTYFFNREFNEASKRYEEFTRSYPASPDLPYVRLQAARSLVLASKGGGRDRGPHEKALTLLESIITQYPNTAYAAIADKERLKVAEELSSYDRMVIDFYARRENTAAVEAREKHFKQRWASILKPRVSSEVLLDSPMVPIGGTTALARIQPYDTARSSSPSDDGEVIQPPIAVTVVRNEESPVREALGVHEGKESQVDASAELALAASKAPAEPAAIEQHNEQRASVKIRPAGAFPIMNLQRVVCRDQGKSFATIELSQEVTSLPDNLTRGPIEPEDGVVRLRGIKIQSVQPVFDCFAEGDLRITSDHELELDSDESVTVSILSNPARLILVPG